MPKLGGCEAFLQEQNVRIQLADFLSHQPESRAIGAVSLPGVQRHDDERFVRNFSVQNLGQSFLNRRHLPS
jgi:hypothetical protein